MTHHDTSCSRPNLKSEREAAFQISHIKTSLISKYEAVDSSRLRDYRQLNLNAGLNLNLKP